MASENAVFVSVRSASPDEITAAWAKLREGATVITDPAPPGGVPSYGMLKDRHGVVWVLDVAVAYDPS